MCCTSSINADCCCGVRVQQNGLTQSIPNADSCPPWFVYSNKSVGNGCSHCACKEDFGDVVICDEMLQEYSFMQLHGSLQDIATTAVVATHMDKNLSFGTCLYVYYSNIVNHAYTALPHNIIMTSSVPH